MGEFASNIPLQSIKSERRLAWSHSQQPLQFQKLAAKSRQEEQRYSRRLAARANLLPPIRQKRFAHHCLTLMGLSFARGRSQARLVSSSVSISLNCPSKLCNNPQMVMEPKLRGE